MIAPSEHIGKARALLRQARYLLEGGFNDGAARDAYTAGLHAALAWIVQRNGREPKTHSGARGEFARLIRDDARLDRAFAAFLANAYELKTNADYGGDHVLPVGDAAAALHMAATMTEAVAALVTPRPES